MKITKRQLRRIIKEEKAKILTEATPDTSARDDIKDAIQMLESVEDTTGSLFYVIERLYTALEKV